MRIRLALSALALAALALPTLAAEPRLVGIVPDLPGSVPGDDGFAIGVTEATDLSGWSVTDGEDTWAFPPVTVRPGGPFWVVGNLTRWVELDGMGPAIGSGPSALRLGNEGDQLTLLRPDGSVADAVDFGKGASFGSPTSPGLVLLRLREGEGWRDTDSPDDWRTPRMHRVGESDLPRPTFEVQRLTLYASPDSSFQVLTGLAAGARERLHLHVYELRSPALVDALVASKRASPALDLQVLVDGNPVGMTLEERHAVADALRRIEEAGGRAVLSGNGRYDDHHLKVLVADGAVAVQSENWVASGVPQDPSWGNRGWGAVVHEPAAADWFAGWMQEDRDAWDSSEFDLAAFDPHFVAPLRVAPRSSSYEPVPAKVLAGTFRVTPFVAPDHTQDPATEPVSALVAAARTRVEAQQLDLSLGGGNSLGFFADDPLTQALATAARQGARVRAQAASPFAADDTGNTEALDWLADQGVAGRLFDRAGFSALHNKGVVADDIVVVGSMNGNLNSRAQNREVGLVLEGPGVADYYAALAAADWSGTDPPRDWSVPAQDLKGLPGAPWPMLLAILAVGCILARRWS